MAEKAYKSLTWSDEVAMVVIRFKDADMLRDAIARIDKGEVVDPVAEHIAAFAHVSSSDQKIFKDAKNHAESLGKSISDILAVFMVDNQCHTVVYKHDGSDRG